jgi:hypothetical protein
MNEPTMPSKVLMEFVLIALFLPMLIGFVRNRNTLILVSAILCAISGVVMIFAATLGMLSLAVFPVAGALWLIAMLVGLTAAIDAMAERRAEEHTWRLLNGIDSKLSVPRHLRRKKVQSASPNSEQ